MMSIDVPIWPRTGSKAFCAAYRFLEAAGHSRSRSRHIRNLREMGLIWSTQYRYQGALRCGCWRRLPRYRLSGRLSLGDFCRWRGAFEMGAMITLSKRSLGLG